MCVAVVGSMLVVSCNDENNPTGPSFNKADLVGTWSLTKVVYTEKGEQPEIETFNNEIIYKYTEDNKGIEYSNEGDCIQIDTATDVLNGNKISTEFGDLRISINGNEVTMTASFDGSTITENFTRYTDVVPPASWPTTKCTDGMFKKHLKKIKSISTL
jgi:hypothetical protein